ncbi:MAG: DUF4082 domain-containing protein [Georgenia sp.]
MTRLVRARRMVAALAGSLLLAPLALSVAAPAVAASDPCGPEGNEISCENSKPGTDPAVWDIQGAGDGGIQGFSTDISVNVGGSIDFKIDTDAADYTITIYRTGWYQGKGAREIDTVEPSATLPQVQPECLSDLTTELYDCGNWAVSATWAVPATAVSGVYVAKLRRPDTGDVSHITFVVRDDASDSDVFFQTSDTTWHAYNTYGGASFYQGAVNGRAYKLSYNRPFATRGLSAGRDFYFASEYAMVRFLERNGYDVSYTTDVDSARRGELIQNHKVFTSTGHDEYWSGPQRTNIEAARDAGVHLGFFTGNEAYWRVRWENAAAGAPTPYRTMTSYKETWDDAKIDPSPEWTGTWRDPRFAAPENGGGLPENAVSGTAYMVNDVDLPVTVSAEEGRLRLWRHTSLASLPAGGSAELAPHTVGYESNEDLDNGFRPEGLVRLSTTVGPVPQYLQDFGSRVAPGTTNHNTTLYRAASGALVFSSASIQWAWGLDQVHDGAGAPADPRMQQATVNLLADMDSRPTTLQSGLVAATKSTDTAGPTVTVTSPVAGQEVANGISVVASGTATDVGGRVAGVEVSTDGGDSWHPAKGTTAWSYTYVQTGTGTAPLLVRAVDDSANIGTPARVELEVSCPCSIFGSTVPKTPAVADDGAVELGLRFSPQIDGFATGVRFYKGTGNTGQHIGSLWSATGQRLGNVTFTDESSSGWQSATFTTPVPLTAGTTYVVSYTAPVGRYAAATDAFWYRGLNANPLNVAGGFGVAAPGVYAGPGTFPDSRFGSSHYFVDVVFSTVDDTPLTIGAHEPLGGSTSVPWSTGIATTMSKPVDPASVQVSVTAEDGTAVAGQVGYDVATRRATFTPAQPLAPATRYTVAVAAVDSQGLGISGDAGWSFTTAAADRPEGACPCSLFNDTTQPTVLEIPDSNAVTLGVTFTATTPGTVSAVRFYKGPGNVGTHTGALWSAGGTKLAEATFSGESTQGWQTVTFATPVAVEQGVEYVASYRTTVGRYSYTAGSFGATYQRGPLTVPPNGGTYSYADTFPGARTSGNYLVDVVFEPDAPAPVLVEGLPRAGALGVGSDAVVTARFDVAVAAGVSVAVTSAAGAVAGTVSVSADGLVVTFAPAAPLAERTRYTVAVTGTGGAAASWEFETAGADGCPCTLFSGVVPTTASTADGSRVELGVQFTPSVPGVVTGVRFYKGATNTGAHTGTLWSATGEQLATVAFVDETATGWQTASFGEPVAVVAGTSYVVSYLAPSGGYAVTSDYFGVGGVTVGPLTAGTSNGRYTYGGGFPTSSYRSGNYFVDLVFEPREPAPEPPPAPGCPCTLFGSLAPAVASVPDTDLLELGTAFTSAEVGTVTGVRFYKGPLNTGVHTGSLWTADGTLLATVEFTGETATGWQSALFAEPVAVTAGTTYVVSYLAPGGGFSRTDWFFAADHTAGPLTAPAVGNGRFRYGGGFPTGTFRDANYFVDVLFATS